jgi:hypothetical protein
MVWIDLDKYSWGIKIQIIALYSIYLLHIQQTEGGPRKITSGHVRLSLTICDSRRNYLYMLKVISGSKLGHVILEKYSKKYTLRLLLTWRDFQSYIPLDDSGKPRARE